MRNITAGSAAGRHDRRSERDRLRFIERSQSTDHRQNPGWKRPTKIAKSLLLGSAAVLAASVSAEAADLPTRKAAPVQYVKICDAYGAGFFYIPGTDTCLRVGGLVLVQAWTNNTPYRIGSIGAPLPNYTGSAANLANGGVIPAGFQTGQSRDNLWWTALGRVELDARTQSPWGTVRAFLSVETVFGTGGSAATGSLSSVAPQVTPFQGTVAAKEATYINKAFIQFAGVTMGRIQSMFDFYADTAGAMTVLRGSNQTVNALAYTAVLGGGITATLSLEDEVSHRARGTPWSTIAVPTVAGTGGAIPVGLTQQFLGTRMPDVVANLRIDQPWGSAQVSGAIHRVGVGLYNGAAAPGLPVGQLLNKSDSIGYAVQAGVKFNLPMIAPGDALWLQATYGKGAIGYVDGTNFAFTYGIDTSTNYGIGIARVSSGSYWFQGTDGDCVFTQTGSCDKSKAWAIDVAFKHFWTPTISTTLVANYYQVNYSNNALNPAPLAALVNGGAFTPGLTNYKEYLLGAGIQWSPIQAFTISSEFTWQRGITPRPVGLASDVALLAAGLPAFKATSDLYRGRVRMIRAF